MRELLLVDEFYNSIGGLAGYQLKCLEMMLGNRKESTGGQPDAELGSEEETKFHMPQGLNIAYNRQKAAAAAATGLEALPHMGEILPLGGAGPFSTEWHLPPQILHTATLTRYTVL